MSVRVVHRELAQHVTVERARKYMMDKGRWATNGTVCPCCLRRAKVRFEHLNASEARSLWVLCHESQKRLRGEYLPICDILEYKVDYAEGAKLAYWGLLEEKPSEERGKTKGQWRVTQRGWDFVTGKITVPKEVVLYAKKIPSVGVLWPTAATGPSWKNC